MKRDGFTCITHTLSVLLAVVASASLLGCSVDDKTQITIALSSETEIPKELDAFSVRVISTRTGELRFSRDYAPESGRDFPSTLAVIPLDASSLSGPLRFEVEGRRAGVTALRRESVLSYFRGRNLLLPMPLRMACFQFRGCGAGATCIGGECVDTAVDSAKLADFDEALVFPDKGACFDEESCLGGIATVKVDADCTFALPEGAPASAGNVAIRWAAAPERVLALEADDTREGWTRLSPTRGRLSQGTCDSHFQRRDGNGRLLVSDWAERVYFSGTCAPKNAQIPYCRSARTQHAGIGAVVPAR